MSWIVLSTYPNLRFSLPSPRSDPKTGRSCNVGSALATRPPGAATRSRAFGEDGAPPTGEDGSLSQGVGEQDGALGLGFHPTDKGR